MGTMSKQPERNDHAVSVAQLQDFIDIIAEVAKTSKVSPELVVAAARVLEMRRTNDLRAANGDIFDEQVAGLGELLERIAESVSGRRA